MELTEAEKQSGFFARLERAAEELLRAGSEELAREVRLAAARIRRLIPARSAAQNFEALLANIDRKRSITKGVEEGLEWVDLEMVLQLRSLTESHRQKNSPQTGGTYASVLTAIDGSIRREFGEGPAGALFLALIGEKEIKSVLAALSAPEKELIVSLCKVIADAAHAEGIEELSQPFRAIAEFF